MEPTNGKVTQAATVLQIPHNALRQGGIERWLLVILAEQHTAINKLKERIYELESERGTL